MKKEFLEFLHILMDSSPEIVEKKMTENVKEYIKQLEEDDKITEKAKVVLKYLQETDLEKVSAKDIGESLGLTARSITGSIRSLVNNNYVEKIGQSPVKYTITKKGKEIDLTEKGEKNV